MWSCPACNREYFDVDKFCKRCGFVRERGADVIPQILCFAPPRGVRMVGRLMVLSVALGGRLALRTAIYDDHPGPSIEVASISFEDLRGDFLIQRQPDDWSRHFRAVARKVVPIGAAGVMAGFARGLWRGFPGGFLWLVLRALLGMVVLFPLLSATVAVLTYLGKPGAALQAVLRGHNSRQERP